jgi:hypothetical protein
MRLKLRAAKSGKADAETGPVAMFGQQTSDKKKKEKGGERDMSKVTWYGVTRRDMPSGAVPTRRRKRKTNLVME